MTIGQRGAISKKSCKFETKVNKGGFGVAGLKLAKSDVLGQRAGLKLGPETWRCTGGISEKKYI